MRFVILLAGLLGAVCSGFAGLTLREEIQKFEAKGDTLTPAGQKELAALKAAVYPLVASIPLAVVGIFVAFGPKGRLAAIFFIVAYTAPLIVIVAMSGVNDRSKEALRILAVFPAGLAVAGVLSLFLRPRPVPSRVQQPASDEPRPQGSG